MRHECTFYQILLIALLSRVFIVPSVLHKDGLIIAISTSGLAPALSRQIRFDLRKKLLGKYTRALNILAKERKNCVLHLYLSPEEKYPQQYSQGCSAFSLKCMGYFYISLLFNASFIVFLPGPCYIYSILSAKSGPCGFFASVYSGRIFPVNRCFVWQVTYCRRFFCLRPA